MLAPSPTRGSLRRSKAPRRDGDAHSSTLDQEPRPQPRPHAHPTAAPTTATDFHDEYVAPPVPLDAAAVLALQRSPKIVISITGLSADDLQNTVKTIENCCRFPFDLSSSLSERTSLLLVASSGTVKHATALKRRIPCVDIAWVTEGGCDLARVVEFPVRSLRGRLVSSTSLSPQSIDMLQRIVAANGGHYRADLNRKCDLLVVPLQGANVTSEKVRFATTNRIRITPIDQLLRRVDRSTLIGTPFSTAPKTTSSEAAAAVAATTSVDASVRLTACVVCITPASVADTRLLHMMNALGMRRVPLVTPSTTHLVVVGPSFDCVAPELRAALRVVTAQWVAACYEKKFAVPTGPYRATLPHQPVFTFSGVSIETKAHLTAAVVALGGQVQDRLVLGRGAEKALQPCTTHLVIAPGSVSTSEKAKLVATRLAETHREECRVVTPEFIVASALEGSWVDSLKYQLDLSRPQAAPAPAFAAAVVAAPALPSVPHVMGGRGSDFSTARAQSTACLPELTLLPKPATTTAVTVNQPAAPAAVVAPAPPPVASQFDIDELINGIEAKEASTSHGLMKQQHAVDAQEGAAPAAVLRIPKLSEFNVKALFATFGPSDSQPPPRSSTVHEPGSQVVEYRHQDAWVVERNADAQSAQHSAPESAPLIDSVPFAPPASTPLAAVLPHQNEAATAPIEPPFAVAAAPVLEDGAPNAAARPPLAPRVDAPAAAPPAVRVYFPKGVRDDVPDIESMVLRVPNGSVASSILEATHFITCRPNKTEAFLSALAAQLWVLTPQFVVQSAAAGRWLPETQFEWSVEQLDAKDRASGTLCNLVLASRRERQQRRRLPFPSWHVALCSADPSRAHSFLHVLEAGHVGSACWVPCPAKDLSGPPPPPHIALPPRTNLLLLDDSVDAQVTLPLLAAGWETLGRRGEPRALKITYLVHVLCDDGSLPDDSPEVAASFHPLGAKRSARR